MKECFKCGAPESKRLIYGAVLPEGVVDICNKCARNSNIPIIKKDVGFNLSKTEKIQSVHERLSKISGIKQSEYRPYNPKDYNIETKKETEHEVTLKDLVDKNFRKVHLPLNLQNSGKNDLISNFHWIIMRARRAKCLTQRQFAEKIAEPEEAIRILEKGNIPQGYIRIAKKMEEYFRIRLLKEGFQNFSGESEPVKDILSRRDFFSSQVENQEKIPTHDPVKKINLEQDNVLSFDSSTTKNIRLSDLREMKKKVEEELLGVGKDVKKIEDLEDNEKKDSSKTGNKDDISKDEMDDIIFGRKSS